MQEYLGEAAKGYGQTKGKQFLLIPGLLRHIPRTAAGRLLDIGCGSGDLYPFMRELGYDYLGIDISTDMIARAQNTYPDAIFSVASATDFSSRIKGPFEVVLISMLFPSLESLSMITKVLKESRLVIREGGKIVIGVTHPCFDYYMQSFLLQRKNVETNFSGYFDSGAHMRITQVIKDGTFIFEDYHWILSDYINALHDSGLTLEKVDECYPDNRAQEDSGYFKKKASFPTYLVLVARPQNTP